MREKTVVVLALSLAGEYDTDRYMTVSGFDAYGKPIKERVKELDWDRLSKDAETVLAKTFS